MSKIVGIDIGGTKMLMYANYGGKEIEKRVPTGMYITPSQMAEIIHEFIDSLDFTPDAVGVCVPGLVENGVLLTASDRPNMEGLTEDMIATPDYKVYMINDIRAAMFSQIPKFPKGSSICVIVIGTGIGMSVVLNGHFLNGAKGFVGEWGFCPTRLDDGKTYRMDEVITGKAIVERCQMEPEEIIRKLDEGDEKVTKIVNEAAYNCGICLSYCVSLFNPEYIVLTGTTTHYKNYRELAISTCLKYALKDNMDVCTIVDPEEGGRIVILGTLEFARMKYEGEEMP